MYYFIAFILLIIGIFLYISSRKNHYMESYTDIPVINVNNDAIKKSAESIESYPCSFSGIYLNKRSVIINLDKSYKKILKSYKFVSSYEKNKSRLSCALWLVDNFYIIEREYKDIKTAMPKSYYSNLPSIKSGIYKGLPRIYIIAWEMVSNSDGKIDVKLIEDYIQRCQKNTTLTLGELWAFPIMVRAAIIEKLGTITEGIVFSQKEIYKGEIIADKLINSLYDGNFQGILEEIKKETMDYNSHFVSSLFKSLRDNYIDNSSIYKWLHEELEKKDTCIEKTIALENQKQASCDILMGNCITGLREVSAINWKIQFEKLCKVEQILRKDPSGAYPDMDFESRDYYRHRIEELSKKTKLSEVYITKKTLECAEDAFKNNESEDYENHVGYYLIDKGLKILEKSLKIGDRIFLSLPTLNPSFYIGSTITITLVLTLILSTLNNSPLEIFFGFLLLIIPCSEIIVSALNWSLTYLISPRIIPKYELREGIPDSCSTIVVIPALLEDENRIKKLIADMEVYYIANREKNLYFAFLGDFKDSKYEINEEDNFFINIALEEVSKLNNKYCIAGEEIFYFLNRKRCYNSKQQIFMGWERKRGKLVELNKLLRGDENTNYNVISGNLDKLKTVKYVITLDSDTILPMNSAKKLIGAMEHVLNKPQLNHEGNMVIRGHGLMQPRIGVSVESANKTIFSRIFSGEAGIDIYSAAISDVYEDVFDEGIYTGKGIYNLDVFMKVLEGNIPENLVLSHDLLEGSYVRAALLTDVELVDGFPGFFNSYSKRLHRWIRGDWQIIFWIIKKSPLNILSRWKIFDNIRRSLLWPTVFFLIIFSFFIHEEKGHWLIAAFLALLCPILFHISEGVVYREKDLSIKDRSKNLLLILENTFLTFAFIPYKAYLVLDAITRTIYRLVISKKNLLEWQTAENAEFQCGKTLKDYLRLMAICPIAGILLIAFSIYKGQNFGITLATYSIVWILSPFIAYYISLPRESGINSLPIFQQQVLRRIARKTWSYFEDFQTKDENWMPPDNFQEYPENGVAHRTSPTNLGMGVVSNITAYDFGYIGTLEMLDRLESIIGSMEKLERYRGHFYNWYNTKTMEPLAPRYISTVDSGNLVGYLWLVSEALKEYGNRGTINEGMILGLYDLLILCDEEIEKELNHKNYYINQIELYRTYSFENEALIKEVKILQEKCKNIQVEDKNLYWNNKLSGFLLKFIDELKLKDKVIGFEKIKARMEDLRGRFLQIAEDTDFTILYDKGRQLFAIGYDVNTGTINNCYYDLLASEARQASFVAIAKGDVEVAHWFKLGRALGKYGQGKGLISWSGTMFEYCMPLLIMKSYSKTMLDETYKAAVKEQMGYPRGKTGFFGISESAFYKFDIMKNYQYKAFGVPKCALKMEGEEELVISPYSSLLSMMVNLNPSLNNIINMIKCGLEGRYGFYEAVDYTTRRIPKGSGREIIKSYMVHHQGMGLMAIHNVLKKNILQERFHRIPEVRAAELLLQEKVPKTVVYNRTNRHDVVREKNNNYRIIPRRYNYLLQEPLKVQLLSNGEYSLMVTNRGGGYSKHKDTFLYRWKEDSVSDSLGMFFYIKNLNSGDFWTSSFEPSLVKPDKYQAIFSEDKICFERTDGSISTNTEIIVSKEDNAEIRKITLINHSEHTRELEITSYMEGTISTLDADMAHPAFNNLFISTEYIEEHQCLMASRSPRSKDSKKQWLVHSLTFNGEGIGKISYETSRAEFIGRCRDLQYPDAMENEAPLKNTLGAVLDPVLSLRLRVKLLKGKSCEIYYSIGISNSREGALKIAEKYSDIHNITRVYNLSRTQSIIELKYMGIKTPRANLYQEMAGNILYINDSIKERGELIKKITKGQSALWNYGISGDIPIVCTILEKIQDIEDLRQMILAHEYLSGKGLKFDLVIINMEETDYNEPLQHSLKEVADSGYARDKHNKPGGIFIINKAIASKAEIDFIKAVARIVVDLDKGSLLWNLQKNKKEEIKKEYINGEIIKYTYEDFPWEMPPLEFFNGLGGFDVKNKCYRILLKDNKNTPAPWVNVISNGKFGFQVSENGVGYTWSGNSRENKLTSWSNDAVTDSETEALYLRDELSGVVFGISPKPCRDKGEYHIEHGMGYSRFMHNTQGIGAEMVMFTPRDENVKIIKVRLKNSCNIERTLSITYYCRAVLGVNPEKTAQYIYSKYEEKNDYIYLANPFRENFNEEKFYLKVLGGEDKSYTSDRKEFIKKHEKIPDALKVKFLSKNTGAGYDPCIAVNSKLSINVNEEKEVTILLGSETETCQIERVINKYSKMNSVEVALKDVKSYWESVTGTIKVETPDKTMDIMINSWLIYQTLVCRIWARSGFYQCGGAFGFRDQLQDAMAMSYLEPSITREHIIYAASRQFTEGDVQHWWHPIVESGIRTRFSDDLLWLPYVVSDYIKSTGDYGILYEEVSYLVDTPLNEGEDERYGISPVSMEKESIYNHCLRALNRSLKYGEHGLPLMGSGDWNDGFSTVGNKGLGESVWLGWFLYKLLGDFIPLCEFIGDEKSVTKYMAEKNYIVFNIEENAWDGDWYKRAYFDDGTPLGSYKNPECQIDSLAQSWAVISDGAVKSRMSIAMESLEKHLVRDSKGLIVLFSPPFDKSKLEPGYIKGYLPGVRENGGQYTHAAVWVIIAFAKMGNGNRCLELFNMINPINHSKTMLECEIYKTEPYVIAADVYTVPPHEGMGGWSWYTGAAGWMYRAGIEWILGLKLKGKEGFKVEPSIPDSWDGFKIDYNRGASIYHINVYRGKDKGVYIDKKKVKSEVVPYFEKGEYFVEIII